MAATHPEKVLEAQAAADAHHHAVGHSVPLWILAATFGGLVFLTVVTVAVSMVNLGPLNLWVALVVAFTKASLVVLFFMHMKWDRPMNAVVFLSSLLFVTLFIALALTDTQEYQPQISSYTDKNPLVLPSEAPAPAAAPAAATPAAK